MPIANTPAETSTVERLLTWARQAGQAAVRADSEGHDDYALRLWVTAWDNALKADALDPGHTSPGWRAEGELLQ